MCLYIICVYMSISGIEILLRIFDAGLNRKCSCVKKVIYYFKPETNLLESYFLQNEVFENSTQLIQSSRVAYQLLNIHGYFASL